ncbi:MAG: LL-diaminopimelate aminotransferase [Clostridia bacterium]|jgi:LL-diaminopimelate aminotransferase|nr:LL-diaminopimelate aminotransferase [Clostridia bacterium]
MKINANFLNLKESYLFATVGRKTAEYKKAHPEKNVIRLSIGDVTRPLAPVVVEAMKRAAEEMGRSETFRGYGPDQTCYGYDKLLDSILGSYARKGVTLAKSEVFVSDGAKSDCGNILDIFSQDNVVLVPDPVYPVYVDTNVMGGRVIVYADATQENGFLPMPEKGTKADIIYICSPNNPTGAAYTREQLKEWVDFANENGAVILYDAAYEYFICDDSLCRSIYEVEGAKDCAIEICSYSKTAGFTGVRCGYTIVPETLVREGVSLNKLWARRQSTKFNGVSYVTQMGAAAVFTEEGERQIGENLAYYRKNAQTIARCLDELNLFYTGGKNSPYLWFKCPNGMSSWEFFDYLLEKANVVGTPGSGFGKNGEGFFRLTAFGSHESTQEACRRIAALLKA